MAVLMASPTVGIGTLDPLPPADPAQAIDDKRDFLCAVDGLIKAETNPLTRLRLTVVYDQALVELLALRRVTGQGDGR